MNFRNEKAKVNSLTGSAIRIIKTFVTKPTLLRHKKMYYRLAFSSQQAIKSPYVVLGVCLVLASPLFFLRGIGVFDDSLYLKFGELIAGGALPYRDFFDNKPPGIYYLAAAIAWLGRGHWLAPRIFLFVFAAVFGGWVTGYTQKYWGRCAAYWTAWLFGLSYITSQGYSLHTDQFCAFFGFAGIVVVSGSRLRRFPRKKLPLRQVG